MVEDLTFVASKKSHVICIECPNLWELGTVLLSLDLHVGFGVSTESILALS